MLEDKHLKIRVECLTSISNYKSGHLALCCWDFDLSFNNQCFVSPASSLKSAILNCPRPPLKVIFCPVLPENYYMVPEHSVHHSVVVENLA